MPVAGNLDKEGRFPMELVRLLVATYINPFSATRRSQHHQEKVRVKGLDSISHLAGV